MVVAEMTPLLPSPDQELEEMALEVVKGSSRLVGRLPEETAGEIRAMLRNVNSYYSNLIEGAYTKLKDIERAVNDDFDEDEKKRKLQILHKAHVQTQSDMEWKLLDMADGDISTPETIALLHKKLFTGVPEEFLIQQSADGQQQVMMTPGEYKVDEVMVGKHVPIEPAKVIPCMQFFHRTYSLDRLPPSQRVIAAAASHHRLLWVHPFLEGNGRVARMFTDLYLAKGKLDGYGLWTMSRGLAWKEKKYKTKLAMADAKRQGDYDGRGQLSDKALKQFCRFFLEVALDQISFMQELLSLDAIHRNVAQYMSQRIYGRIPGQSPLPKEAGLLYEYVFNNGKIAKGQIHEMLNVSERKGRDIGKVLAKESLLLDDGNRKAPYRVGFPEKISKHIFPMLISE